MQDFSYEIFLSFGILFVFLFIYSLRFHRITQNFFAKSFCRSLFWIGRGIAIGETKQNRGKATIFIKKTLEISQFFFYLTWLWVFISIFFIFLILPETQCQLEVKNESTNTTCYSSERILEMHTFKYWYNMM